MISPRWKLIVTHKFEMNSTTTRRSRQCWVIEKYGIELRLKALACHWVPRLRGG